ncbi:MAG: vWA domain-containing protein [Brevinemataceae bacterium]
MNFENPYYLLLLLIVPVYLILKYTKLGRNILVAGRLPISTLKLVTVKNNQKAVFITYLKEGLVLGTVVCLIVALARPRGGESVVTQNNLGVDIVLVTDISGSMAYVDEPPANVKKANYLGTTHLIDSGGDVVSKSRLEVAKRVMRNYIEKQEFNRIGLVLFSSYALTKAPLSTDKALLDDIVKNITFFDEGATAIGTGILTGLNRIRNSKAKSKVLILLTDGINNTGIVDPITAANIARELGVKIYTIGFGNVSGSFKPVDNFKTYAFSDGKEYDEEVLEEIAQITGGKFFAAANENSLQDVYDEIDSLEKSEISVKQKVLYEENFKFWLTAASLLWGLWIILNVLFIKIP